MYNLPSVTEPCSVYIFQDHTRPWFKIGHSKDVEQRRKKVIWERFGNQSLHKVTEYRRWYLVTGFAAYLVEYEAICTMREIGFNQVMPEDWFEVDEPTMSVFADLINEFVESISRWHFRNTSRTCSVFERGTACGLYFTENPVAKMQLHDAADKYFHSILSTRVAHTEKA